MNPAAYVFSVPILTTLFCVIMVIFLRRFIHIERLHMIERGMNPAEIRNLWLKRDPYRFLRYAMTAIGVGMGLICGSFIEKNFERHFGIILTGAVCIGGGLGLLIGYIIQHYLENKARKEGRNPYGDEV